MLKNLAVPYSRKEKSLGELSKKFLRKFGRIEDCIISLEQVVIDLGFNFSAFLLILVRCRTSKNLRYHQYS